VTENNVAGNLTDERFARMSAKYEDEQKELRTKIKALRERIEVHQAEKVDRVWVQRLTTHYNCVGAITIPDKAAIPMPDITVNTRKGVYVSY